MIPDLVCRIGRVDQQPLRVWMIWAAVSIISGCTATAAAAPIGNMSTENLLFSTGGGRNKHGSFAPQGSNLPKLWKIPHFTFHPNPTVCHSNFLSFFPFPPSSFIPSDTAFHCESDANKCARCRRAVLAYASAFYRAPLPLHCFSNIRCVWIVLLPAWHWLELCRFTLHGNYGRNQYGFEHDRNVSSQHVPDARHFLLVTDRITDYHFVRCADCPPALLFQTIRRHS